MIRALLRYLLVSIETNVEAFMQIVFERREIVSTLLVSKPIVIQESARQKILVDYLENCRKQTWRNDGRK